MSNIIGIDVSKASLDCACLRDLDQKKAKRLSCKNEVSSFASLVSWAETISDLSVKSLAFVIEPTHVYHEPLVQFLHNSGASVYLVNPGKVRKFAEGIGILSKNAQAIHSTADQDCQSQAVGIIGKSSTFLPW